MTHPEKNTPSNHNPSLTSLFQLVKKSLNDEAKRIKQAKPTKKK